MSPPPLPDGDPRVVRVAVERAEGVASPDALAVEAPLEIRVDGEPLVVTLRTPGRDPELAAGWLHAEGIVTLPADLVAVEPCRDPLAYDPDNVVEVRLAAAARARRDRLDAARRDLLAVAACGLCGKKRLEDVSRRLPAVRPLAVERDLVSDLPRRMGAAQTLFASTGGVHAAALFTAAGGLVALEEDVGRHNAVDKLIGARLLAGELPLCAYLLAVSGRAGFEIVQKALAAGVGTLVAVGAASSLAAELAREHGMELWTFVGPGRGNRHPS